MARNSNRSGWERLLILSIVIAIAITEYIFAYWDVRIGIVLALFTALGIYFVISLKDMSVQVVNSAESLALVPIYILFTSSLPWFFLNQAYLLPCVYAAIMGICFYYIHEKKLSFDELGFKKEKFLKYALLGALIGIPFGTIEYLILKPAPAFPAFEIEHLLIDLVQMILFVGMGEEILFRGLIQRDLTHTFGPAVGILLATSVFTAMHLTWRSVPELVFVFFVGLVLGYLYYKTESLTAPILAHGIGNTILVGILPYIL